MTRCCVRSVYENDISHTESFIKRFWLSAQMYTNLTKIFFYEKYLILSEYIHFLFCITLN